jgi:hypothetical protein
MREISPHTLPRIHCFTNWKTGNKDDPDKMYDELTSNFLKILDNMPLSSIKLLEETTQIS